ncbi:MAG: 30S ribosomal protein S12 methylthiotransferase RimO [Phycisphaerae bacterium]|nr:30S ribosomal protein S12 methylthiotransferase RimO [Phycisphaerae bacterium]
MAEREPITVSLVSLGCPKNLVDSEKMLATLAENGCVVGAPMDDADVIVINTCGFLAAARDESLEIIAEAMEHKRRGRTARIVVAGCLPNRDGEAIYDAVDGIDALVGVNDRPGIAAAVLGEGKITQIASPPLPYGKNSAGDAGRFRLTPHHTAYLRIAEGCSRSCAFCTIPAIRGPFRSKPMEMVLAEARELIGDGALELNVIAQDTTSYGRELSPATTTGKLLRQLDQLDGAAWIRLMYTYPNFFEADLIDSLADCEHVIPYVDMPLQHISTSVLKRMNRGVDRAATEALLERLRQRVEGLVIRTSVIVGFPGETEADFEELLQFVRDSRFDALGVFEFSPEEGTAAFDMPEQIPADVAAERAEIIMQAQAEIATGQAEEMIGQQLEVLVDGIDPSGLCVGRYYGQAPDIDGICILAEPVEPGQIVPTKVIGSEEYDLIVQPA